MAIPQVLTTFSFDEWRQTTNTLATSIGDFALIYDVGQTSLILAVNDLNTRKANLAGSTFTGAVQVNNTLGVTGTSTLAAINASGNIVVGSNRVTMNATSGNTVVAGTLDVAGTTGLAVLNVSGATAFTLSPTGPTPATNDNTTKFATTAYYIGQAGTASPLMNGDSALVGTSYLFSRQDHVHIHDTAKLNVANPSATGTLTLTGGTVAVSTPLISATQTWDGIGVSFSGITVDVTNTASADTSLILDFKLAGVNKFGVDVHGCVVQKLSGTFLARDVVSGTRHVREYQDLADSSVQGMDSSKNEWGYTWNAKWNGSSYDKDRNLAGDHAIMMRLTNGYKQHWWFSDGTTPGAISWVKRIDFDFPANTGMIDLALNVVRDFTVNTNKFTVASATGNTVSAGTITSTGFLGNLTGNADTVTNGVYTTGSYADPAWITSLAKSKVGLGNVENTALSTWAGTTNITTLGTIGTGVWSGTSVGPTKGGTGFTSLGTSNQIVGMNNAAGAFEYKSITSSDSTISITHAANSIDIKTSGVFPGSVSFTGDLTVGSPAKFTVASATGNTVCSGTLNVASTTTLAATSATTFSASTSISSPIITNGESVSDTSSTTTTSTTLDQVLDTVDIATYRSVCFEIQAVDSTGAKYHRVAINAIHNGTTPDSVEFGAVAIGGVCGTFTTDISGGNLRLLVTPSSANSTTFKVRTVAMKV